MSLAFREWPEWMVCSGYGNDASKGEKCQELAQPLANTALAKSAINTSAAASSTVSME